MQSLWPGLGGCLLPPPPPHPRSKSIPMSLLIKTFRVPHLLDSSLYTLAGMREHSRCIEVVRIIGGAKIPLQSFESLFIVL